jgi:DNA replication initiation complex subunit (GINS family)
MYEELFVAWRFEVEHDEIGDFSSDFFGRLADYVARIKRESRMLDKKGVKAGLLEREMEHVQRMISELVWARYGKLISLLKAGQKLPSDLLAAEEAALFANFGSFIDSYHNFVDKLLQGHVSNVVVGKAHEPHKRVTLRFLKAIPAVVGVDMKTYGPFLAEDVGSVPVDNAKILIKRGLAEKVEVSQ